jgi:hypothetical protein
MNKRFVYTGCLKLQLLKWHMCNCNIYRKRILKFVLKSMTVVPPYKRFFSLLNLTEDSIFCGKFKKSFFKDPILWPVGSQLQYFNYCRMCWTILKLRLSGFYQDTPKGQGFSISEKAVMLKLLLLLIFSCSNFHWKYKKKFLHAYIYGRNLD